MKLKRLALPAALIMAGTLVFGAGCGENVKPEVTVQDGYVYVDGEKTDIQVNEKHTPAVTVQDGYVYVDGEKTDIQVNTSPGESAQSSAFELWKQDRPDYAGTETDWLAWLDRLVHPQEENMRYSLIENGIFTGSVVSGAATAQGGSLKLQNAVLRLAESVVLPVGEGASWEAEITGTLLTGSATGAQILVGEPFTNLGRVYLGVNKNKKMLYLGVRLNTIYVNFGWTMDSTAFFNSKHTYKVGFRDGEYYLSVDGAEKKAMTEINFNQDKSEWLGSPAQSAADLNGLIRTVASQDAVEMTKLGAEGFAWSADIENFSVSTSVPDGYRRLLAHPLANTKIFYLGSSITYGYASGGVAFGEILHALTGNPFQKEAVSGTTLVDNGSSSYVQRLHNLNFAEKPDYLVVQLSTNDFSQTKPMGTVQDGTASSGFDTSTVSGAIQYIIAYAKEQCPTCKVVFYTGAVRNTWGYKTAYENYVNGDFKKICEKWDIEPLDIFHARYTNYSFFWNDDIHPTLEGYSFGWTPLFMQYFTDRL